MKTPFRSILLLAVAATLTALPCLAAPEISIDDISAAEGAGNAVFTVSLSEAVATPVTVDWITQDGTAGEPGDYTAGTGIVTFPANVQTRTISVPVINDTAGELAETFSVSLSNASANATIADSQGDATIGESDITLLSWDPGTAHLGSVVQTGTATPAGRRYFKINAQGLAAGAWRTALGVTAGEADLYAARGYLPTPGSAEWSSVRAGADGWVLRPDQFSEGETWYFLVDITAAATWRLYTGDAYVQNLGTLQYTDTNSNGAYNIGEPVLPSGSGAVGVGPEGMRCFTGQAPNGTPAWSLWLSGDTRNLAVRQAGVPFHDPSHCDHKQSGAMLLVPDYLGSNSPYFFSVIGNPGDTVTLDSRIQVVSDIAFESTQSNVNVTAAPFRVYRVQVPIDQIAWDVSTTAVSGNPNVSVRRNNVPSQWFNDAFSEVTGLGTDSVTLVPDFLTDATWFITVYGTENYQFTLRNGAPVITPMNYVDSKTNDQINRTGWRFYSVSNIPSQTGSLGWELALASQVPGTEIALRRNAVPGRWNYRNAFDGAGIGNVGFVDLASDTGLLQQPGHQADLWYVGVYQPNTVLGAFTLNVAAITAPTVVFNNASSAVTDQLHNSWRWFRIDVPAGVLGWDLRLRDITGGNPLMMVGRDLLPTGVGTGPWVYPNSATAWPSGSSWTQSVDWTGRVSNPDETSVANRRLVAAMGRPLEAGTYYVGVYNADAANDAAYTLESRGIGAGQHYTVGTLGFAAGSNTPITNLAPREAAYFKVTVPSNTPSWEITLDPSVGEMLLMVRRGAIPDPDLTNTTQADASRQVRVQKEGPERYLILPPDNTDFLIAGDYYLAVVSEGQSPADVSHTGSGNCSGVLTSRGSLVIPNLGAATVPGLNPTVSLVSAQMKGYHFTVPVGTQTLEMRLNNRVGNPQMTVVGDLRLPQGSGLNGYGSEGGQYSGTPSLLSDDNLITIANPPPGDYTVAVSAAYDSTLQSWPPASATLLIQTVVPTLVLFSGGTSTVAAQQAQSWKYFRIEVPAGVLGWDLRLRDITGGNPQMVVGRDLLPSSVGTSVYAPNYSTTWPSGDSWTQYLDWTGRGSNPDETAVAYHRFVAATGRPLEQGTYYVGVYNADAAYDAGYTVDSRGIGAGHYYPVSDLNFATGSNLPITSLVPREAAYFKVTVPANTPNWEITLDPTLGEMMLMVRRGAIPDPDLTNTTQTDASRQVRVQKNGPERFVILPPDNTDFLVAGDYYLAVVSEGQTPADASHTGTGNCSGVLTSRGSLVVPNLGPATEGGIGQTVSLVSAQMKSFHFTVTAGTATLEMRLNDRVGNPQMAVVGDLRPPQGSGLNGYGSEGGQYSGTPPQTYDDDLITIANPPPGDYTVTLSAAYDYGTTSWDIASATLLIQAVPAAVPTPVAFAGGTSPVTGQQAQSWKYFRIEVPAGVLGWDLRLRDLTGGNPKMVVARDVLPSSVGTGPWSSPNYSTAWPSGDSWTQYGDWTGRGSNPDETSVAHRRFVAATGRPLEPGTYYVGVYNADAANEAAYTVDSRGIGAGQIYPVTNLNFAADSSTPINNLAPREAAYFKVTVPANTPNWEITLDPTLGEMMLMVRRGAIPDPDATNPTQSDASRQVRVQKNGPERFLILPPDNTDFLVAGDYYLAVVSEGLTPADTGHTGSGDCSGVLTSRGSLAVPNLGSATEIGINQTVNLASAQIKSYRFTVTAGSASLELRLNNRVGNPQMALVGDLRLPQGSGLNGYGCEGGQYSGTPSVVSDDDLITITNPPPGSYTVTLSAAYDYGTTSWPSASADLLVRRRPLLPLNFAASQNGNGNSNTDSRQVISGERTVYAVDVPTTLAGQPVLGWKLQVATTQGAAILRVHKTFGDTSPDAMITVTKRTAIIVPPWLTPGNTWHVEVEAQGVTDYTLTSSPVELNHNPWTMPVTFNQNFADSGVQNNGTPFPGDQGTDLAQNDWHFYAIDVPAGNGGLLRTELQAISGNPDLFLREDGVPTPHHNDQGASGQALSHRSLTGTTTEYGNWVPLNGRTETQLRPGRWYLGVNAAGNSNVRYRLKASTGSVTDLSLNQAPVTGQTMAGGDWRYYRFTIPLNAPSEWQITFSQQLGDAVMWIRDTVPPGDGANSAADGRINWATDNKNQGPYPSYDPAGTYPLATPQLRPGHTYFAGFRASGDATFSLSSATAGGTIGSFQSLDFYTGSFIGTIPANGSTVVTVAAPLAATLWKHRATHSAGIEIRIEQGSLPPETGPVHYTSGGAADSSLNMTLTSWPWVPGPTYFIRFVNPTGGPLPMEFYMGDVNDDGDHDGLPDAWEVTMFGNIAAYNGHDDPDHDGVGNLIEFAFGLNPNSGASMQVPQAQVVGGNLVISFTQPAGTTSITYSAEWSPTMAPGTWLPVQDTGGGGDIHTFSLPIGPGPAAFIRLIVTSS